jgi:hypothetical protein
MWRQWVQAFEQGRAVLCGGALVDKHAQLGNQSIALQPKFLDWTLVFQV